MDYARIVEGAVNRFYAAGDNEAHVWILQAQDSSEAWSFVWHLLLPTKSKEVQFFAANTLHSKISKQWEEVPSSEYSALRDKLLSVLKQSSSSKLIVSKLCQAMTALLININTSETEDNNKGLVEELIELLPPESSTNIEILLRILSYVPKESECRAEDKRRKFRNGFINNWNKVAWILQEFFTKFNIRAIGGAAAATTATATASDDESCNSLHVLGFECIHSWFKIGYLPLDSIAQIFPFIVTAILQYLPNRENLDADEENTRIWESLKECLLIMVTHAELSKRPKLFWEWAHRIIVMAREQGRMYHFYEIVATLGETYSRNLLLALGTNNKNSSNNQERWISEQIIEILLQCSNEPGRYPCDERRSCIPFGFWFTLQDDINTLDQPMDHEALVAVKPIYARLAEALLRKSSLPVSPAEAGDDDDRELFRCYRQDAADTLVYCYNVIKEDLLLILGQRLSRPPEEIENWTYVESSLHAFNALSDSIGLQECYYVPSIMNIILSHIPYENYPEEVLSCACLTVGAYAEWLGEHPEPWLEKSLKLITVGLTRNSVITAPTASMALKDISRECDTHLAPLAPYVLEIIGQCLLTISPTGLEGLRLMYAAAKLLNVLPTTEQQLTYLNTTLGLCVTRLKDLLRHPVATARIAVSNQLKMIAMFFSTLAGSMGKIVLDGLLPLFKEIIIHPEWSRDDSTLEAMHSCAQKSLSSLLHPEEDAKPLLTILSMSYKIKPHPSALSLLRQLVLLFGRDSSNVLGPVFAEVNSITLTGISICQSVGGSLSDLSDLLETYLNLLAQICKKNATLLLQIPDQVPQMLKCGIACLLVPETKTARSAGYFLTHAIMQNPHLQTFIQPVGQELVCVLIQCIVGNVPRNNLETHAEVLLALNKMCSEWTTQWLRNALINERTINNIPQALKENFIRNVVKQRTSKLRLCDILKEFSSQCLENRLPRA